MTVDQAGVAQDAQQGSAPQDAKYPPGSQIEVRDEEWLVRNVTRTAHDGERIEAVGVSEFVRDQEAVFFTKLDDVQLMDPSRTRLTADDSPNFRRSRLFLEAVLRKTPLPQSERGLALADGFLLDSLPYQHRPAQLALSGRNLRPRMLIADVVGLGKTLEIGLTLAELIRRGRGERILIVTPQHVLEQFQHELWTRFAIPLIRLDSVGIERIQREIPAGRNPFTYFKRVIVSIDTLKNTDQYKHHLEHIQWDAVVIDESHNLINRGSLRNQLARLLAPQTDALILASATPHNGNARSFAELISLLDPAAIRDPERYEAKDIEHLFIRRTKVSPEVREQMKGQWADRGPSESVHCAATEAEERIFEELAEVWLPQAEGSASVSESRLFPYTLLKSFLSSHAALAATVGARIKTLTAKEYAVPGPELAALKRLKSLTADANNAWTPTVSGNYHTIFTTAGTGNATYPTQLAAYQELVNAMAGICDEVANGTIDEPFTAQDPSLEESPFAQNSIIDFTNNIKGVQDVYLGKYSTDGKGLEDLVRQYNLQLDSDIKAKIDNAINALGKITDPFGKAITTQAMQIETAMSSISDLKEILETQLLPFVQQHTK